jgi:hypothetical protein
MTTTTETKTIKFAVVAALALGAPLEDGTFAGLTTLHDGTHVAVVYLGMSADEFNHAGCIAHARERGGELMSRTVFHLLRTTIKEQLPKEGWCFTADTLDMDTGNKGDASYAWFCYFNYGFTGYYGKRNERQAVAVRLIHLEG